MKLAFYGGTFNPPHNGHKMIIEDTNKSSLFEYIVTI